MNILILGASGGVGRHLVRLALEQGHAVTALTRTMFAAGHDGRAARVIVDDVVRAGCFDDHVAGHDVVLSSLGLQRANPKNPWSALTSPTDFNSSTATALVAAMKKHRVSRVIAVSAAGVGDSAPQMNAVMKLLVATSKIGVAYRDLAVMERVYDNAGALSGLDWCCPRPTRLTDGPQTGQVRTIDGFPMDAAISRADVAWWMLEQLRSPTTTNRLPTITG